MDLVVRPAQEIELIQPLRIESLVDSFIPPI